MTRFNRQINPINCISNGFVIFNSSDSLLNVEKLKSKFDNVYLCSHSNIRSITRALKQFIEVNILLYKNIDD